MKKPDVRPSGSDWLWRRAAYAIDSTERSRHFSRVPPTAVVRIEHSAFFDAGKGYYGSGLQSEQALPLYLGVVPAAVRQKVLDYLVHDIEVTHGGHTTAGIVGIKCTLEALSAAGRTDVALRMLARTDCKLRHSPLAALALRGRV